MKFKRGIFFSLDALIALVIIISVLLISFPMADFSKPSTELHYDVLTSLSSLKTGEINNDYVKELIQNNTIKDSNKSLLEQIGEFYIENPDLAKNLADEVIKNLETNTNIGIWYDDTLISSKNSTPYENAENVEVARQVISGISEGNSTTGFVAKAWLKKIAKKTTTLFIKGELICGRWKIFAGNIEYCGSTSVDIDYKVEIPSDVEIINATWLVEPSWVGQPTKLFVNGIEIFSGEIQYFETFDITSLLNPGNNTLRLSGNTGGDDGASHVVVKYSTPSLQTLQNQNIFSFYPTTTRAVLHHEKSIFTPDEINFMEVIINTTSSTTLSLVKSGQEIIIGTNSPANGKINFTNEQIESTLNLNNLSYSDLNNEYFLIVAEVGTSGTVSIRENSYVYIETTSSSVPFGSIDITEEIKPVLALNNIQDTAYRNIVWEFNLPNGSIPVMADWLLGWLNTGNQETDQIAKANGITLYDSPPDPFIAAFSRFGYSPSKAAGVLIEGKNNFTLDFGNSYGVSNESSFGALTFFIRSFVNYGDVFQKSKGSTKTIEFEDGTTKDITIGESSDPWDPADDAIDNAIQRLLSQMDADSDGKIDLVIDEDSVEIDALDVSGVPLLWSTEVQVRVWN